MFTFIIIINIVITDNMKSSLKEEIIWDVHTQTLFVQESLSLRVLTCMHVNGDKNIIFI